jgi:hypothetical protein
VVTLDHIPIWTDQRDHLLAVLRDHAGLGSLAGFSPNGQVTARGVRFRNGPFLDVHQISQTPPGFDRPFHRLVALGASIDELQSLATAQGWAAKAARRLEAERPDQEPPWSLLSFRRGQGLLSQLFGIEYHPGAATTPEYSGPLYASSSPATGEADLLRVWLPVENLEHDKEVLKTLGARPVGTLHSASMPYQGEAYAFGTVQIVLSPPWGPDRSLRLDIHAPDAKPAEISPLAGLLVVISGAAADRADPGAPTE